MLRTPASDMYVFRPDEVLHLGINKLPAEQRSISPRSRQSPPHQHNSPEDTAELAKAFILGVILSGSLPTDDLLEMSDRSYAEIVNFYGKQLPKGDVLEDKRGYAERWPERVSVPRADSIRSFCSSGLCYVSGIYDWQVSNPKIKKRLSGVATFEYTVNVAGMGYSIVAEGGKVIQREPN
jgi:hypothetical protein